MNSIALIILVILFLGTLPVWPHSEDYGYWPSGGLGAAIAALLTLFFLGYIPGN